MKRKMQTFSTFGVFIAPFWSIGVSALFVFISMDDAGIIQILRTVHVRLGVCLHHLFSFVFEIRIEFGVCLLSYLALKHTRESDSKHRQKKISKC